MRAHLLVTFALLAAACGGQDVDPGTSTNQGGQGGAATTTSTGAPGGGGAATGGSGTGGEAMGLADVELIYKASSTKVDVAKLATVDYKGSQVVPLPSVWSAGMLTADTTALQFDFEGDDGFHPSMKGGACLTYPKSEDFAKGYILPETRTLVWDDSLGFPGCFSVKSTAKIIALDYMP